MGKLVIKLDKPILYGIIEQKQLLFIGELDPANISAIVERIGDYPIEEVSVYMKFDTRQEVEGIEVDRIYSDYVDMTFKISQSDYDALKMIALVFKANLLSIYSAYKHYAVIITDGIVIDPYIERNYIVAGIQDGKYRSLNICSTDRLQRMIETCQQSTVTYAAQGAIPALSNIEHIPSELHETLSFLQFILYGSPCYQVRIDTGEVFEYGDQNPSKKYYNLPLDEEEDIIKKMAENMGSKVLTKKVNFTYKDILLSAVSIFLGIIIGLSVIGLTEVASRSLLLNNELVLQRNLMERQEKEIRFLESSIYGENSESFEMQYQDVKNIIGNDGVIVSIRFIFTTIELTLFVVDEPMKDRAVTHLEEYFYIESCEYERVVSGGSQGQSYLQYNIILN